MPVEGEVVARRAMPAASGLFGEKLQKSIKSSYHENIWNFIRVDAFNRIPIE
jgi:hypothetical protein